MDISKNYTACPDSDAAIILLLGSGGSTPLTKGVSKWLVKQGVNVLSLGPEDGVIATTTFRSKANGASCREFSDYVLSKL